MHWSLAMLLALCGACLLLNLAQLAMHRTVRTAGLLICLAWGVQQAWWMAREADSLALFIACDGVIIAWFLWRHWLDQMFGLGERLIAATIPLTTALGAFAWLNDGHTWLSWWANWWLVAGQMIVGLPTANVRAFLSGAASYLAERRNGHLNYAGAT